MDDFNTGITIPQDVQFECGLGMLGEQGCIRHKNERVLLSVPAHVLRLTTQSGRLIESRRAVWRRSGSI